MQTGKGYLQPNDAFGTPSVVKYGLSASELNMTATGTAQACLILCTPPLLSIPNLSISPASGSLVVFRYALLTNAAQDAAHMRLLRYLRVVLVAGVQPDLQCELCLLGRQQHSELHQSSKPTMPMSASLDNLR